jgi:branched-subunit amino acid aminotransferase/4-amino-4-deoxychorismate lyase
LVCREESFSPAEALKADELLLTGTTTEVMGITHVDGEVIGNGKLGFYSKKLQDLLAVRIYGG